MLETVAEWIEDVLTIAALVSVIWAAIAFVKARVDEREQIRTRKLSQWRKVTVQQLLHISERFVSVPDILAGLRSSSFDTNINIKKEELNEQEVRMLLMEMVEAGVAKQLWGDRYGISHFDFSSELAERQVITTRVCKSAYEYIYEMPGAYTTVKLYEKINRTLELTLTLADFDLMLSSLSQHDAAHEDNNARWRPGAKPAPCPPLDLEGKLLNAPSS